MSIFRRLLILMICLFPAGMILAQTDIRVRLVEPAGFIAPGEVEYVVVEIINPRSSNRTVQGISGGGRSGRAPVLGTQAAYSPERSMLQSEMARNVRCQPDDCIVQGEFPLQPGQSLLYRAFPLAVPAGTTAGTEFAYSKINVKLNITGDRNESVEYYTDADLIRLVSADGTGEVSIFEGIDLTSPAAGRLQPDLVAQFDYVDSVDAGGAFDVYATIINNDEDDLTLTGLYGRQFSFGFSDVSGEHARSFRFVSCMEDCLPAAAGNSSQGSFHQLASGESVTYLLGTYYYENDSLFDGQLIMDRLRVLVHDSFGRSGSIRVQSEPIIVNVLNTSNSTDPTSRFAERPLALEVYDLTDKADQLLVYDPNTGLEWLRMTAGAGYSLEEMLAQTRLGGKFENFVLASSEQVESLVLNHVNSTGQRLGAYALYNMMTPDHSSAWQSLLQILGPIPSINSQWGVIGVVSDPPDSTYPGNDRVTTIEISAPEPRPQGTVMMFSSGSGMEKQTSGLDQSIYEYMGYWLVRE